MKAASASSIGEMVSLHRSRGPHHVRRVIFGTQEARPGPLEWSSTGVRRKGRPERRTPVGDHGRRSMLAPEVIDEDERGDFGDDLLARHWRSEHAYAGLDTGAAGK